MPDLKRGRKSEDWGIITPCKCGDSAGKPLQALCQSMCGKQKAKVSKRTVVNTVHYGTATHKAALVEYVVVSAGMKRGRMDNGSLNGSVNPEDRS